MTSWRLYLATGRVEYADQIERTLFNVMEGAVSREGDQFFYANTLYQRTEGTRSDAASPRAESSFRSPWFDVSCCPPNIARTTASLGTYLASAEPGLLTLLQYATCQLRTDLGDGSVELRVTTRYPLEGTVEFEVLEAPDAGARLRLRVPAWSRASRLVRHETSEQVVPGWVETVIGRGDRLRLEIDVSPRVTWPDPRVDAVRGCVALERGPLVLCLEAGDLPDGTSLDEIAVDPDGLREADSGVVVPAWIVSEQSPRVRPFGPPRTMRYAPVGELPLVPYFRRADRGTSVMRVFLPVHHGQATQDSPA